MAVAAAQLNQAVTHHQRGDLARASSLYRSVLAQEPQNADALHLLGVVAKQTRQFDQAAQLIEAATQFNPDNPDYHNNLAEVYRAQFRYPAALASYNKATALLGEATAPLLYNLGGAYQEMGDHESAIACFSDALTKQPKQARFHFRRAYSYLTLDDHTRGWRDYEWHFEALTGAHYIQNPFIQNPFQPAEPLPRPSELPSGHSWAGSRVLLQHNQGLGDELCLLRFLPNFQRLGVEVVYSAPDKLVPLLQSKPEVNLWDGVDDRFDHVFCLSELPYLSGMQTGDPLPAPLQLRAEAGLEAHYRALLSELPRPWIGVTWRAGTPANLQGQFKEVPFAPLLAAMAKSGITSAGTVVLLQRDAQTDEIQQLTSAGGNIVDMNQDCDDPSKAAAIMALLDDYVAVCNTNVHLRTSLGLPSHVLTTCAPIDYRWPHHSLGSPWFPGCKAYRQSTDGTWVAALDELTLALTT